MCLIKEIDYGTPASMSEKTVTLTIDGREVSLPEGTSIMRAAMEIGVEIPSSARPTASNPSARAACASSRSRAATPSRLLHDAGRAGNFRENLDAAAACDPARDHGALHLRPSARLPDLPGQW